MSDLRAAAAAPRRHGRRRRRRAGPSRGPRPGGSRSGHARSGVRRQTRCHGGRTAEQKRSEGAFEGEWMCTKQLSACSRATLTLFLFCVGSSGRLCLYSVSGPMRELRFKVASLPRCVCVREGDCDHTSVYLTRCSSEPPEEVTVLRSAPSFRSRSTGKEQRFAG